MKIRRGFVSNSSTYSFLAYVKKDEIDKIVFKTAEEARKAVDDDYFDDYLDSTFQPIKVGDFGDVFSTEEEFRSFIEGLYNIRIPNEMTSPKSPDRFSSYSEQEKEKFLSQFDRFQNHLVEFKRMKSQGYVAMYILQSTETEEFTHYVAYCGNLPFSTQRGFTVIG